MEPFATLDGATLKRRHVTLVDGASLEIRGPSLNLVSGSNGSGKTSLLLMIAGLADPTKGSARLSRPVSYLPEKFRPPSHLPTSSYLKFAYSARGLRRPRRARSWAQEAGLLGIEVTDAPLKNLSKGDLQKVGILQALAFAPALVVLDEPLEGLDESARSASLKLFAAAVAEGSALVVSFHGARNFAQVDQEFIVRGGVVERARTSNEHRIVLSSPDDRALPTPPQGFRVTRKNGKTIVTMPASETVAWVAHLHQSGWSIEGVLTSDVED